MADNITHMTENITHMTENGVTAGGRAKCRLPGALSLASQVSRGTAENSVVSPGSSLGITWSRAAKLRLLNFLSLFRDLQKPTRFGGGEVVAAIFRDLHLREVNSLPHIQ